MKSTFCLSQVSLLQRLWPSCAHSLTHTHTQSFNGIVHQKMCSSFTHPYVVASVYEIFWRMWVPTVSGPHWPPYCARQRLPALGYPHSSKYLLLYSTDQRNSYRFGTTWGWVNDGRLLPCLGSMSPQPVGASGQLGKEQTLPYAEDLFSRHGVGLGQPHSMSLKRVWSVNAEILRAGVPLTRVTQVTETFWFWFQCTCTVITSLWLRIRIGWSSL